MINAYKKLLILGFLVFLTLEIQAQVKLKLSLLSDQRTYVVSMIPDDSWEAPMNMVGSSQIVMQMDASGRFQAGEIRSLIPGLNWTDNAYIDKPGSAPDYNFVCFALKEQGTKKIPFIAGVETPLFSFVNLEADCVGEIRLVENNFPHVKKVVEQDHFNITQNIAVLGARGNAFTGITEQGAVNCLTVEPPKKERIMASQLSAFPIPATDVLHVLWKNEPGASFKRLLVYDFMGKLMVSQKIAEASEVFQISLDVSTYPSGLYTAKLIHHTGEGQNLRFIVTRP